MEIHYIKNATKRIFTDTYSRIFYAVIAILLLIAKAFFTLGIP